MNKRAILKLLGGIFISLGIVSAFIITAIMVWGDLEASVFTNGINGDSSLKHLKCPVIITENEIGSVSVEIRNPIDRKSDRYLRAFVSEGFATLVREIKTKVPLPPNGKQKVEWKVYPEDAAFKRIILFRVLVNAKYPYPSMSGNCGILKINVPWLNGNQVLAIAAGFTISTMGIGIYLSEYSSRHLKHSNRSVLNSVYSLAALLFAAGFMSYFGLWLIGLLGLAAGLLMVGVIVFRR